MNSFAKTLSVGSLVLCASILPSVGRDSDPGYGPTAYSNTSTSRVTSRTQNGTQAYYYRPTMRYYGKGYTVAYGFVPWNDRLNRRSVGTFQAEQLKVPANAAVAQGADRVTYRYQTVAATTPAVEAGTAAKVKPLPPVADTPAKPQ